MKNPSLAFALGFLMPPLGLFYVQRYGQALFFVLMEMFGVMTIFVGGLGFLFLFLFGLYCGFYCRRQARRINSRFSPQVV